MYHFTLYLNRQVVAHHAGRFRVIKLWRRTRGPATDSEGVSAESYQVVGENLLLVPLAGIALLCVFRIFCALRASPRTSHYQRYPALEAVRRAGNAESSKNAMVVVRQAAKH